MATECDLIILDEDEEEEIGEVNDNLDQIQMFDEEKSKHETFVFELKTHEPKAEDPYLVEEPHSALLPKNNSSLTNGFEVKKDKKKTAYKKKRIQHATDFESFQSDEYSENSSSPKEIQYISSAQVESDTDSYSEENSDIESVMEQNEDLLQMCQLMARTVESTVIKT